MFLHGTAELFTDTRQNTVFTSVGGHLSDIAGSTRSARRLNSFVGRPDSLPGLTEIRINEIRKNDGQEYYNLFVLVSEVFTEYESNNYHKRRLFVIDLRIHIFFSYRETRQRLRSPIDNVQHQYSVVRKRGKCRISSKTKLTKQLLTVAAAANVHYD